MKRVRNPSIEDIQATNSMLVLINYYLDPKDTTVKASYHSFSAEHHAAINERVKFLYDKGGFSSADFFNVRCHIVSFLEDELKERIIGECIEKKSTLYVYPKPDKALYRRVLVKHGENHSFEKSRGFCVRSSIGKKNVNMIQLMIRRARSYAGLALKKDKKRNILYGNACASFAIDDDYIPVLEVVDEIMSNDVYSDYKDDAGVFTGKSKTGFYIVENENKTPHVMLNEEEVTNLLMQNRVSLVPKRDKKEDGTEYAAKVSLELTTKNSTATTQIFKKNGNKHILNFEHPEPLLASQMEKHNVTVTKKGTETEVSMPTPKLTQSKAGKEISEKSILSNTECELLVTMSAWNFGTSYIEVRKEKIGITEIGSKLWASKITIEKDNIGSDEQEDGISDTHRDIEIPYEDDS